MLKLYEIKNEYVQLIHELEQTEEITAEHEHLLESIEDNFNDKALAICAVIHNLEGECNVISSQIRKFVNKVSNIESNIAWLCKYLESNMITTGIDSIKSPLFNIRIKKNPPKVHVTNQDLIPLDYKHVEFVETIDKKKISAAIKSGIDIPGAELIQEQRLEIK